MILRIKGLLSIQKLLLHIMRNLFFFCFCLAVYAGPQSIARTSESYRDGAEGIGYLVSLSFKDSELEVARKLPVDVAVPAELKI